MSVYLESDLARFWQKVDRSDGSDACWPWTGARQPQGYGVFRCDGRNLRSSRVAWELTHGTIPDGLWVLHHCDNPPCSNPAHLWLGTARDNARDRVRKGRSRYGKSGTGKPRQLKGRSTGDSHYARLHPERLARGDAHGNRMHPERTERGEDRYNAVLSNDQVYQMLSRYAVGESLSGLVEAFGVSKHVVFNVVHRRSYKSVEWP